MEIKLYDTVISVEEVDKIPVGTIGAVVEIWEQDESYEIEFIDKSHKTIDCVTMKPSQFRKLTEEEIKNLN